MPAPDPSLVGPAAGLLTSVLWTFTTIFFTLAGRRLGSTVVNATRIALAIVILALIHRVFVSADAAWIPAMNARQLLLLAVSGVIGLSIGDQALFTAFLDIGPRLSTLLMTTSPIFAALFAWVALGERMGVVALLGMGCALAGVGWVILERPRGTRRIDPGHRVRGISLALAGAACQACGLMLSKAGIGHGWMPADQHMDPQAATLVRMVFAGVGMVPILLLWRRRMRRIRNGPNGAPEMNRVGTRQGGLMLVACGAIFGPVLGVWMSLVAADATSVGIAQTLMGLTPILILPYAHFVDHEPISWRAVLGAVVAVGGVAILCAVA